jgi:glycosyltransferase involved in cell wall biosynthesis
MNTGQGAISAALDATPVSISVIVPCRNAAPFVGRLLLSLVGQQTTQRTEIIFVDNGSTDGSRSIAEGVSGLIPLRIVEAKERANASYARNVGVRCAKGDRLLFVDADDEVAPGYVEAMARALESHSFVTSRVDSCELNEEWVREAHGPHWQADGLTTFFGYLPGAGVNIALRRDLFEAIGGFPEDFAASQDLVFSWRAQGAGARIEFVRDALYYYRYRHTLGGLFRQSRTWGTSNVLLFSLYRDHGMPSRSVATALREWSAVLRGLLRARTKGQLAPFVVRLGYCVGRVSGSVRYRVLYL